jgi:hypothetical protein
LRFQPEEEGRGVHTARRRIVGERLLAVALALPQTESGEGCEGCVRKKSILMRGNSSTMPSKVDILPFDE